MVLPHLIIGSLPQSLLDLPIDFNLVSGAVSSSFRALGKEKHICKALEKVQYVPGFIIYRPSLLLLRSCESSNKLPSVFLCSAYTFALLPASVADPGLSRQP